MSGFDWPSLIRFGLRELRLKPEVFWGLSPAELRMLLGLEAAASPLLQDDLAALMAAYPDRKGDDPDG